MKKLSTNALFFLKYQFCYLKKSSQPSIWPNHAMPTRGPIFFFKFNGVDNESFAPCIRKKNDTLSTSTNNASSGHCCGQIQCPLFFTQKKSSSTHFWLKTPRKHNRDFVKPIYVHEKHKKTALKPELHSKQKNTPRDQI